MKNEIIKESNLSWIASSYCTGHTSGLNTHNDKFFLIDNVSVSVRK